MRRAQLAVATLMSLSGCFGPNIANGVPCAPDRQCPPGQICAEDDRCYDPDAVPDFTDGGTDGSSPGTATRAGTITLAQVSFKSANPEFSGFNLRGPAFELEFVDLTTQSVAPTFDDNSTGTAGCTVFEFTTPAMEPAQVDEGMISVVDFGGVGDISCLFDSVAGYRCSPITNASGSVGSGSTIAPTLNGVTVDVSVAGADFSAIGNTGSRGMSITFPPGTWDDDINNGTFPINSVVSQDTVAVTSPLSIPDDTGPQDQNDYTITVGDALVLAAGDPFDVFEIANGQVSTGPFNIAKGSGTAIEPFNETIRAARVTDGELDVRRLDLQGNDAGAFNPFELPTSGFTISCADNGVGGNCQDGTTVSALVIAGRTTDGPLPTTGEALIDDLVMPAPVGSYSRFFCIFEGQKTGTVSQGAVDAVRSNPNTTRIETSVFYASGQLLSDTEGDSVRLLSGYGLVGFTDP